MRIATKYFGTVEVAEEELIQFERGLPGFEGYHSFVLIPVDEQGVYQALQSMEEAGISLIVTNAYMFYPDYAFDLDEKSQNDIELKQPEDLAVYNVVTLKDPFEASTINLQAPIVINKKAGKAKQLILNDNTYQTRHPLLKSNKGGDLHARP
ncbi:flagellar assembly protein FliW [Virgibacillus sediminis]|uniref:Flagellar assembly factor FliW n=1 Tax=Virgibacillus sediminis TaxID=202260 RepID=A0ABV7A8Z7_9BACI